MPFSTSLLRCAPAVALAAGLVVVSPAASAPPPLAPSPQPGCGTWVLQEAADPAALEKNSTAITTALATEGVKGLSLRVPWSAIDKDFALLDRAAALAKARGKQLSVRFLAGRSTPARVFNEGAYFYSVGGQKIPKPFSDSGVAGNPVFERNYRAVVTKLAAWSRKNGIRLLHLPWYGYQWAEIYHGYAVKSARGYSYDAWKKGHLKLVDIGLAASGSDLTVEFAMSGDWGGNGSAAADIADRIIATTGEWSRRVLVQGNGMGRWNNPATSRNLFHAKQMVSGGDFNWTSIYQTLRSNDEAYVEVYATSFSGARKALLSSEAKRFSAQRC